MEELFNNMIANAWDAGLSEMYENPLSYEMIEDSVGRACDFFHIEPSESIEPGHTTAVSLGDTGTYGDEILFFNRLQLEDMGITGQDGLDLVMTHEGTHIALQDLDTGFNCYQEELCCDYMAGIRAGLNGIDVTQLENTLMELPQEYNHPVGTLRVNAIEQGIAFAHDYLDTNHESPKFDDCYEQFKNTQAYSYAKIAELMDEHYTVECSLQHYKDQLNKGTDEYSNVGEYEDAIKKYVAASTEYAQLSHEISFKSRESMLPYEEYSFYDPDHPERNPFGIYAAYNFNGDNPQTGVIEKPYLPEDFLDRSPKESAQMIKNACDRICNSAGLGHLHVFITTDEEKATNGTFEGRKYLPFTLWDNAIYLNRNYMQECVNKFGTTDVILFLLAHEIGHAVNEVHCGHLVIKDDENLADMFSALVLTEMGVDTDIIRQWNQWEGNGHPDFYKPMEGRWDAATAGTYWAKISALNTYLKAIEDPHFRELAYYYNTDSEELVIKMAQKELDYQINEAGGSKDNLMKFLDCLKKYMLITRI